MHIMYFLACVTHWLHSRCRVCAKRLRLSCWSGGEPQDVIAVVFAVSGYVDIARPQQDVIAAGGGRIQHLIQEHTA